MASQSSQTLLGLKAGTQSKILESKQILDRQRDILVLIQSHLNSYGYTQSAAQLQSEAGRVLQSKKIERADNIDLLQIVTEYEAYYEIRFGKKPKFSRRVTLGNACARKFDYLDQPDVMGASGEQRKGASWSSRLHQRSLAPTTHSHKMNDAIAPSLESIAGKNHSHQNSTNLNKKLLPSMGISSKGKQLLASLTKKETIDKSRPQRQQSYTENLSSDMTVSGARQSQSSTQKSEDNSHIEERVIKPLPSFGGDAELRSLAASIQKEILDTSPEVSWDDIIELEHAKLLLKEAVVMPLRYPQLFCGLLVPWRGILLFGAPGTGKTCLAKAVATQSKTTFFNISASSIVSKFRGESEKLIKILFELARYHAPSTIFMDEIDAVMGHRGASSMSSSAGESSEHEGSRRMKTELLVEMDGLGKGSQRVFLLAASNLPWDLDPALLRRLEKRIMVPMPDGATRKRMISSYLQQHICDIQPQDIDEEGYSGADIKLLCKEAAMRPVRSVLVELEAIYVSNNHTDAPPTKIEMKTLMQKYPIRAQHLKESCACTKSSTCVALCAKYKTWDDEYGST